MTISSENRKAGPFLGNGITTAFPFAFKVFATSDVYVVRANSAGAETVLSLGTHYTVALNANQNANPGGTVTLLAALASGFKLVVTSEVPELQSTDLTNQGGFYPSVINAALDRLTILAQQLREKVDRSAKLPITSTEDADALVADIVLLADNVTQIATVAANIASVSAVAGNATNVNAVAGNASNINTVAGISANVTTVAGIGANVTTVAGVSANVTTVAGIAANVTVVSGNAANINTVAANAASVNSAAANMAAIIAAPAQAAAAAASYDAFDDRYLGSKAADPTLDNDGNALLVGALYWNTVAGVMKVYDGAAWSAAYVPAAGYVQKTGDTMTGPLVVPSGASGSQVPRASEVRALAQLAATDIAGTSGAVANGEHKRLTNAAASTVTTPAAATAGDRFRVSMLNGRTDNTINWNGLKHEGLSDATTTVDVRYSSTEWEYTGATYGWKRVA